ncbi:FAD-dependent monooxygenase [Hasllibacter halocynthiae]|uniref:FAD-dependent monooxygenase n=1 Tax=Hasllibacter halocynthiae TaxID=595589 RepID=UPI002481FC25|nr:FAD-dependent monooxygenase [Hasllibacter halocynthiae]
MAGGGIAGLAAALSFARLGGRVVVSEVAPVLREVGAGLQLSPNGHRVLDALGLSSEMEAAGERTRAVCLVSGRTGRDVARLPLDRLHGFRLLHRADLHSILERACREAGVKLLLGRHVGALIDRGRRPTLRVEQRGENELLDADLVIGADGVGSRVRDALAPGAEPAFTGQVAWRATVEGEGAGDPVATVHLFPGRHVVTYPLRGGALWNVVAVAERGEWRAADWRLLGDPDEMRAAFADASPGLAGLLQRVGTCSHWGLHALPKLPPFTGQGVALIGDAAHPTLPFLAQGANLALEDALSLALATDAPATLDRALRGWEAARRDRVARALAAARDNARNYHMGGPGRLAGWAALGTASVLAPGLLLRRYRWLWDADVTA